MLLSIISLLIANKEAEKSRFLDTMLHNHYILLIFWDIIKLIR